MATTDEEKLIAQIKQEIKKGDMEFYGKTEQEGVEAFEEYRENYDGIEYGFVNVVIDGEVQ